MLVTFTKFARVSVYFIDVKKRFFTFFIPVTFLTFFDVFYFVNVFYF